MIMMGIMAAQAIFGHFSQRRIAKAQQRFENAKAEAENTIRKASNEYKAASANLANFVRTANNQKLLDRSGEERLSFERNMTRTLDAATRGGISEQISNAEQLGQMAAVAGATGVGGSTIDMIKNTTDLAIKAKAEERDRNLSYMKFDALQNRSAIMSNAVNQMDENITFANIDLNESTPAYVPKPTTMGLVSNLAGMFLQHRNSELEKFAGWRNQTISQQSQNFGSGFRTSKPSNTLGI